MAVERWERYIRTKPNQHEDPRFHITPPEDVEGRPGVTAQFICVRNGKAIGSSLEDGFYVQTNVAVASYLDIPEVRESIRTHIANALVAKIKPIDGIDDGPIIDVMSGIDITEHIEAPTGGMVLRIQPLDPAVSVELGAGSTVMSQSTTLFSNN